MLATKIRTALNHHGCQLEISLHVCFRLNTLLYASLLPFRYNKFAQITARAVRSSLKEEQRLAAEKRGVSTLRYQKWENGKGGAQVRIIMENFQELFSYLHRSFCLKKKLPKQRKSYIRRNRISCGNRSCCY